MSLDISKLENVRSAGGKTIARCPACGEKGKDRKGEHLAIFPDGKFWCISDDSPAHRSRIFRLVGVSEAGERAERGPVPIPIRRPACAIRKPRTVRTLNFHLLETRENGDVSTRTEEGG